MKTRLLSILFLALAPFMSHAQTGVSLRGGLSGDSGSTYAPAPAAGTTTQHVSNGDPSAPLRAGDTIDVRVSNVPNDGEAQNFNSTLIVDDEGMINLPYINAIKVAGLLPGRPR